MTTWNLGRRDLRWILPDHPEGGALYQNWRLVALPHWYPFLLTPDTPFTRLFTGLFILFFNSTLCPPLLSNNKFHPSFIWSYLSAILTVACARYLSLITPRNKNNRVIISMKFTNADTWASRWTLAEDYDLEKHNSLSTSLLCTTLQSWLVP